MTEIVSATFVTGRRDNEALYIEGELAKGCHSMLISDIGTILEDRDIAIGAIDKRRVNMYKLGITTFPDTIAKLDRMEEFADEIQNNTGEWEDKIRNEVEQREEDYIMTDEMCDAFELEDGLEKVLVGLFSTPNARSDKTPLGNKPVLELDHDNSVSGIGPAAYRLC